MAEEIFGPILPILEYKDLNEVVTRVNSRPKPLALYYFTNKKENERKIIRSISYGGGCINDTIMHLATSHMPFGGVGESGMGGYHGKASFDTFSHKKSILKKSNLFDIPLRYPPYKDHLKMLKKIMK
jgi:aldehyde dehydrogenase (NAD+)